VLMVQGAFGELGVPVDDVVQSLALELMSMASWLGLHSVEVGSRGDLASPLAAVVHHYAHH
ncbi:MAG: hypothetical protein JWN99_904, partial [Ilumatobacteraceae bacterium]|nr:hypothetical protein [Ilumatobacteraceae bacterium]